MNEALEKKMKDLVSKSSVAVLASLDPEGYPRGVAMAVIKTEGIHAIWFATGKNSEKTQHYQHDEKASVCFLDEHDSVTLTGTIEIKDDPETRKALWVDWFIHHFPQGIDDPNYCLLRFVPNNAIIWIDQQFERIEIPG